MPYINRRKSELLQSCTLSFAILALLLAIPFVIQEAVAAEFTNRPFRMGFTGFVYDITPEAVRLRETLFARTVISSPITSKESLGRRP